MKIGPAWTRWVPACAAAMAVALAGCGGGGGGGGGDGSPPVAVPSGDYYPLAEGDRWLFDQATPAVMQRVNGTRVVDGETAIVVKSVDASGHVVGESLFVKSASGVRQLVPDGADSLTRAVGPLQTLRLPLVLGDSFTQIDKTIDTGMDFDGDGRHETMAVRVVITVAALERVTVPAGSFDDCVRVRTTADTTVTYSRDGRSVTANVVADEWLAAGIGTVKSVSTVSSAGQSETSTQALTGYGVGGRHSESALPTVATVTPADGGVVGAGTSFGTPATVSASFSEAMDSLSLQGGGFVVVDAAGQRVAGTVDWSGVPNLRATFTPAETWISGAYTARLTTAATDRAGNPLAAERSWHFTIDATAPAVVGMVPAAGSQEVGLMQAITLTFSEPLDPAALQSWMATLEAAPIGQMTMLWPVQLQLAGNVLTITPTQPLPAGVEVRVSVSMLRDTVGNIMPSGFVATFRTTAGRYAYPVTLATGQSPVEAVAVGDVNGDGRPDVLLATGFYFDAANDYRLFVFAQRADGTLAPPVVYATGSGYATRSTSMAVTDIDGDGRLDVLLGQGTAGIEIFLQRSDGTLASSARLAGAAYRMSVADFNGDGRPDIAALGFASGIVQVWLQQSGGGFGTPTTHALDHGGWEDLAVGDINGDGRPDIVVTSGQGNSAHTLGWLLQNPDGSFGPAAYRGNGDLQFASAVVVGDVNGDGRADLVASNLVRDTSYPYTAIGLLRQNADGSLAATQALPTYGNPGPLVVGDVDGDGRRDLVVAHSSGGQVGVYLQRADGTLAGEALSPALYGSYGPGTLALGDVNGDGRPDIVLGGSLLLQRGVVAGGRQTPQGQHVLPTTGAALRAVAERLLQPRTSP